MGEFFYKGISIALSLFISVVFFSVGCFAVHSLYPSFSSPESSFTFDNVSGVVSVSDYAVYGVGYYSVNGSAWQSFSLAGQEYDVDSPWLTGFVTGNLPSFGVGEHYVIVYGCTYFDSNSSWDCHGNKWQLIVVNNSGSTDVSVPVVSFESPTPINGATITASSQRIVAGVSDDSDAFSSWIDFDGSLVCYWSMDYSSSTGVYDNSSYKNFGTFNGGLGTSSIVAGVRGKALSFNGKATDYVNVGDRFDLGTKSWTYSFWFKEAKSDRMYILMKGASGGFNGIRIETYTDQKGAAIFGGASDYEVVNGPNILLDDGGWHHIVVTFDRNGNAVWYTDSVAGSPVDISVYGNENIDVSDNFLISGGWNTYLNGSIDEVLIFNRALSSTEVKALYNSKVNKFDATFSNLANGLHNYSVYAIDGSGNFVSSSRNFNVNAAVCSPSCSGKQCGDDGCTGFCGTCSNAHGSTSCSSSGLCQPVCSAGYANCDSNNVNGCETQLGTTSNCAFCGNVCLGGQSCTNNICTTPLPVATCNDGIQNQGETGIDCGGPCSSCSSGTCGSGYNCGIMSGGINCGACPSGSGLTCTNNLCVSPTSGQTLYVATNGNDNNPGTFSQPLATINRAWSLINSGGVIYVRGGTYTYSMMRETVLSGKSGQSGKMINLWNYPGEKPVIDFSANTFSTGVKGILLQNANYVHIKGIRIANIKQPQADIQHYGMILWDNVDNSIFEQIETDHIGGWGVVIGDNSNNNLFLNCDSHHNADPNSCKYGGGSCYGGSDGFETGSHGAGTSTNNIFRGCRAWANSDDGWDLRQADGIYKLENCWSFWNGFIPETVGTTWVEGGNGEGFKLGGKTAPPTNNILRTVTNSIAFRNRCEGFDTHPDSQDTIFGAAIYNSIAYDNSVGNCGAGFFSGGYNYPNTIRNCISYSNNGNDHYLNPDTIRDHNSFDLSVTVSNSDFLSLDSSCMDDARKADGSLPDCNFLHLASGSDLIDKGVNVGLPYSGNAPDLGAFEYP